MHKFLLYLHKKFDIPEFLLQLFIKTGTDTEFAFTDLATDDYQAEIARYIVEKKNEEFILLYLTDIGLDSEDLCGKPLKYLPKSGHYRMILGLSKFVNQKLRHLVAT